MVDNPGYILLKNKREINFQGQLIGTKYEAEKIIRSTLTSESTLISNQKKKQKERSTVI
jgi:hypothetical protein